MKRILFTILLILLFVLPSYATTAWWEFDCSEPNIVGFRLYHGEVQGTWNNLIVTIPCPDTSITLPELPEGYYVVKAYDTEGLETGPSNEVLFASYYYNSVRYDYNNSGMVLYKGEHTDHNASENDVNWVISKYYYTGGMVMQIRRRTTSWTNRATGW